MRMSSQIILKGLIDKCPDEKREILVSFLSPNDLSSLKNLQSPNVEFSNKIFSHYHLLDKVHYSWFVPTLKSFDNDIVHLFLSCLGKNYAKKLSDLLSIEKKTIKLSLHGKKYLRELLLTSLLGEKKEILPIRYLPESSLTPLLTLKKQQLIDLIQFLSLYDLASELPQIVDPTQLKKIQSILTPKEKSFLKAKKNYKETFNFPPLGLKEWKGNPLFLKKVMHKRGIYRLSQALCVEHQDLIWYICHELDIGRGAALFKLTKSHPISNISEIINSQIIEIISLLSEET
jgi:hypothetical protein